MDENLNIFLTIETNNFPFEVMVILGIESTCLSDIVGKIGLNGPMTNKFKV